MTDVHTTYIDAVLAGTAKPDEVDDWVDRWHETDHATVSRLDDYLGLTGIEGGYWGRTADIASIIAIRRANGGKPARNLFWVSWYAPEGTLGKFELYLPWWISGWSENTATICAAIVADDVDGAREAVYRVHDERPVEDIEFRFVDQQSAGWQPFSERFPRADWMCWPDGSYGLEADRPRTGG